MITYHEDLAEQHRFILTTGMNATVTYEEFVCNLVKDMGSVDNDITHMALGIAGEAGELVDAIKKRVIYDKPLDVANVVEELGDLEFYMAGLRQRLGISRLDTLEANITKLQKRYANGYSDAAAQARADKKPEQQKIIGGKPQAINLQPTSIAGMDDMAETGLLTKLPQMPETSQDGERTEISTALDSYDPTPPLPDHQLEPQLQALSSGNLPDQHRP